MDNKNDNIALLLNAEDEFIYTLLKEAKRNIDKNSIQYLVINSKGIGENIDLRILHYIEKKYLALSYSPFWNSNGNR